MFRVAVLTVLNRGLCPGEMLLMMFRVAVLTVLNRGLCPGEILLVMFSRPC
jgi:hypothetical protein